MLAVEAVRKVSVPQALPKGVPEVEVCYIALKFSIRFLITKRLLSNLIFETLVI